jgi:RNA polymerase sigma-70 factor (ECF subfamily)
MGERVQSPVREIATWLPFQSAAPKERTCPLAEEITALFRELRSPLLRYTLSLGLSLHDGEDVVQEVFLSLFRHLQDDRSRENLRGWIFRVGHNLALKRRLRKDRNMETALEDRGDWALPDPAPNPEEQFGMDRRKARLRAVVQALPERDRCCLNLRAEGLRYREIAGALDISVGAVALSLSRSLAKLSCVAER